MNKHPLLISILTLLAGFLLLAPVENVAAQNDWALQVSNLSGNSVTLDYDELLAMPKTIVPGDLSCYGILLTSANWGGVELETLLSEVGIDQQALSVEFTAQDGYMVALPLERAIQSDVVVAYEREGEPLSEKLRLVVPGANGNVWIAMITSITLSTLTSQIEGQSGLSPLDRILSLASIDVQNSTQNAGEIVKLPHTVDEPANDTATRPKTPQGIDTTPSQQQEPKEAQRPGVQAEIVYSITFVVIAAALAAAGYLIFRRGRVA